MNDAAAHRFTIEMEASIKSSGIGINQLAAALGCSRTNVWELRRGRIPRANLAARLASILDNDTLTTLARQARSVTCPTCRSTVQSVTNRKRYCSEACGKIGRLLGRRAPGPVEHVALVHLARTREAVAAFCRSCEPEGVCRQPACQLRPVSPLPCAAAPVELPIPPKYEWSEVRRQQQRERMLALHARRQRQDNGRWA